MPRRVAMVVMAEYPEDSRVRREAEALTKNGYEVDIICQQALGELPEEKLGNVTVHRVFPTVEKESFADYFKLTINFSRKAYRKLNQLDNKRNYDLVQIHNMPDYLIFTALRQWFMRKPIVLDLHDLTPELFESKWGERKINRLIPLVKSVESICCKMAAALITTSVGFEEKLLGRGIPKERMTMILNSADENFFFHDPNRQFKKISEGIKFIYHGTVAERFGIKEAIEAVHKVKQEIPNPVFNIYGTYDPSYKEELINLIQELDLTENVFLNGYLLLEDVRQEIIDSDFGVVNYLEDDFMNLALSTKGFEYVAVGIPVIASRLKPMQSLFPEGSLGYVKPGDPNDFAATVLHLAKNPKIRQEMVKRASVQNEEIAWQKMASRYVGLIDSLINTKPHSAENPDLSDYDVSPNYKH